MVLWSKLYDEVYSQQSSLLFFPFSPVFSIPLTLIYSQSIHRCDNCHFIFSLFFLTLAERELFITFYVQKLQPHRVL